MSKNAPETFKDLRARYRAQQPTMTPAAQRIADYLTADPAAASRLTVTEAAERTGSSEATVVRTARLLGYRGYRDLRLALATAAASVPDSADASAAEALADIAPGDSTTEVIAKLAREEQQVLADTAARLDPGTVDAVADAIAAARRVEVYGVGASALVAHDLAQKLMRIGLVAQSHQDPHLALTTATVLRPGDLAVGVSYSGATTDVVDALRAAGEAGATTVAVTARPRSALAHRAAHVLTTATGRESELRPAAMASRSSQLLVVDCLFTAVAQRTHQEAVRALTATHQALASRHPRSAHRSE